MAETPTSGVTVVVGTRPDLLRDVLAGLPDGAQPVSVETVELAYERILLDARVSSVVVDASADPAAMAACLRRSPVGRLRALPVSAVGGSMVGAASSCSPVEAARPAGQAMRPPAEESRRGASLIHFRWRLDPIADGLPSALRRLPVDTIGLIRDADAWRDDADGSGCTVRLDCPIEEGLRAAHRLASVLARSADRAGWRIALSAGVTADPDTDAAAQPTRSADALRAIDAPPLPATGEFAVALAGGAYRLSLPGAGARE